jgi:Helicase HerA, central domain
MKDTQDMQQQRQPSPPLALYNVKRDQVFLTGGVLLATSIAEVALHANPTGVFFGLLGTFLVGGLSDEILDRVIPGRYARRLQELPPAAPAPQQRAGGLARLFSPHRHVEEEEEAEPEEETPAPETAPETGAPQRLFPLYHERETLRLGKVVKTGQRFDPHFNELLGKGIISSAVMGSGKSMANGLIIERAALAGMPAVVFDHKGEYASITELDFAKGLRVGADSTFDFCLTGSSPETLEVYAYDLVRKIIEGRYQAVIDLPSYGLGWIERARIVSAVGKALMAYSAHRQRHGILLIPTLVVLDEAQLYLPENIKYLPSEAKNNLDVLSDLNNAFFAMASNGRSNGYTTIISTPSLTYVAKAFIKSSQIYFFLRHSEKNDLDECMRMLDPYVTRQQMETMPIGCGVVKGFTPTPLIVRFDTKKSRDLAQTPMLERLRMPVDEPMEPLPMRSLPDAPQPVAPASQTAIEKLTAILAESFTETELLAAINALPDREAAPARQEVAPVQPRTMESLSRADRQKVEWAHQLWEKGEASVRKLEAASGWSNGETRRMIRLMRDLGWIPRE